MTAPPAEYPGLGRLHFNNARAFFDRSDMLLSLRPEKGLVIGEVGVGLGKFSRFLLEHMRPASFVAIDLFDLHTMPDVWGSAPETVFHGMTHRAFYEKNFVEPWHGRIIVQEGESHMCLAALPDDFFDILYVDADHSYESVKRDAEAGAPKVKLGGLLVFNDYTLHDHLGHAPYGVVQAVNELIAASNWKVVGFSLQRQMYCDIALQRA